MPSSWQRSTAAASASALCAAISPRYPCATGDSRLATYRCVAVRNVIGESRNWQQRPQRRFVTLSGALGLGGVLLTKNFLRDLRGFFRATSVFSVPPWFAFAG